MPYLARTSIFLGLLLTFSSYARASSADPLDVFNKINYLPAFAIDGCHQKATMISIELQAVGIPSAKIVVNSPDNDHWIHSPFGNEQWSNHAAALLIQDKLSGKWISPDENFFDKKVSENLELFVLDPLFGKSLVKKDDWLRALKAGKTFDVKLEAASLNLEDELGLNESCSKLMTHALFDSSPLDLIRAKRNSIFSRAKELSFAIEKRTGQSFEGCNADQKKTKTDLSSLEKAGWRQGNSFVVMADLRGDQECRIKLGRGGRALLGDEKDDDIADSDRPSYLSARLHQAKAAPNCYLRHGRLNVESIQYIFSGSYYDFFQVRGRLVFSGSSEVGAVNFLIDENGDIQSGRIAYDDSALFSMGINDERTGRGFPPFREEFYYGSSIQGASSAWLTGFGDTKRDAFHQFIIMK